VTVASGLASSREGVGARARRAPGYDPAIMDRRTLPVGEKAGVTKEKIG
jgi:hypothetical protein